MTPGNDVAFFAGAKIALLCGTRVLTYLRDDFAHLPYAAHWDLPGGGREGAESVVDCALRELHEEFGLVLPPARLIWRRDYASAHVAGARAAFFGGRISEDEIAAIVFGEEGQRWQMMETGAFLSHPQGIPYLQARLADWLTGPGGSAG